MNTEETELTQLVTSQLATRSGRVSVKPDTVGDGFNTRFDVIKAQQVTGKDQSSEVALLLKDVQNATPPEPWYQQPGADVKTSAPQDGGVVLPTTSPPATPSGVDALHPLGTQQPRYAGDDPPTPVLDPLGYPTAPTVVANYIAAQISTYRCKPGYSDGLALSFEKELDAIKTEISKGGDQYSVLRALSTRVQRA